MRLLGLATRTSACTPPGPGVRSSTTWLLAKVKTLARTTLMCRAGKLGQARTLYTPGTKYLHVSSFPVMVRTFPNRSPQRGFFWARKKTEWCTGLSQSQLTLAELFATPGEQSAA